MTAAKDIMHTGATCINEQDTLTAAAQLMRDVDVGALPVCGDDHRLKGIITDRDIVLRCVAEETDPASMTVGQFFRGTPHSVGADARVEDVLTIMEQHQVRRLPVVDSSEVIGMISEADIARHLPENIIGQFVELICAPKAIPSPH